MTILQSLNNAYERLAARQAVPSFGFSNQNISFVIALNPDGTLAGPPHDIRDKDGKKPVARFLEVPAPPKRAAGVDPCFMWDKTSYVLGISADEKKLKENSKRLRAEHEAFKAYHLEALANTDDEGLLALLRFLDAWHPDMAADWPQDIQSNILDQNVIFALETDRIHDRFLHDRPAAKQIWANLASEGEGSEAICLVTGNTAPVQRLHPSIKGVWGGQTGGGSIVSFNSDAYESYGHVQGDNAPVSEAAAFGYTTALNKFLEKGSHNRLQIGDASTVFWADAADAADAEVAQDAENIFALCFQPDEDSDAKNKIKPILEKIRNGEKLADFNPGLAKDVRFYVLGLAPNAARISIRFWYESTFGELADNYARFLEDMRILPIDKMQFTFFNHLIELALQRDSKNIPANLSGEWFRSVITGTSYPQNLLTSLLLRIRVDKIVNSRRAAMIKSVLRRNFALLEKEQLVSLDANYSNPAYHFGRLFAVIENFQKAALGDINRTIRDGYFGTAMTAPATVFPRLLKLNGHHRSKAYKENEGWAKSLERQLQDITNILPPSMPLILSLTEQGLFAMGYFHQVHYKKSSNEVSADEKEISQ